MDKKPAANGSTGHEDDPLYNIALESLAPLLDQQQSYTSTQSSSLEVVASQSQHVELSHAVRRIESPNNIDVLSGRGKPFQENIGNKVLHQIVDLHAQRYHGAPRKARRKIAQEIVEAIKSNGSRFLQRCQDDGWREVDDEVAKDKVSHCFRSRRRKESGPGNVKKKPSGSRPPFA